VKNIEILCEDDLSIIINKPAGLAVQGGEGVKSSVDKILAEYFTMHADSSAVPLLVHRLDKDTSGVMLIAKGRKAAAGFSRCFGASYSDGSCLERKPVKLYTAVCASSETYAAVKERLKQDEGVIIDKLMIRGSLKESRTRYKVIKTCAFADINLKYSVLELEPETGRMHQIRRHLAMNGNPILGDDKYGDFKLNRKLRKLTGLKHLLLHASRLIIKEYKIDAASPLPEYFKPYV